MKHFNILRSTIAAAVFLCTGFGAQAQVSVTATAGVLGPTAYTTLDGAFIAINAGTHQGAITVSINATTSEAGACVLNSGDAAPAAYTSVLIRPVVDGVSIAGPTVTGRGLIELNGADNVTIDGDNPNTVGTNRNLTIRNMAANTVTFTSCVRIALSTLITSANNVTVTNCNITGSTTGQNVSTATTEVFSWGVIVAGNASTASVTTAPSALASALATTGTTVTATNLLINNNNVQTVSRGIAVNGNAATVAVGMVVSNNIVGNATVGAADQVNGMGISVQGSSNGIVSGNTVRVEGYVQASASNRGIDVGTASATGTITVERNYVERVINNDQTSWSAFGINIQGGTNHVVRNNFIGTCKQSQVAGTGAFSTLFGVFGIRLQGGTGHSIDYNTVHFTGVVPGSVSTSLQACLGFTATTVTGCNVRNNVFSNQLTGGNPATFSTTFACVYFPTGLTSSMNLNWNNNVYYQGTTAYSVIAQRGTTSGTGNFFAVNFNPSVITPATNWRSYSSTLSVAGTNDNLSFASTSTPPLVSATDLHVNLAAPNIIDLDAKAVVIPAITTDYDGNTRNVSTPDIGADEFTSGVCVGSVGGTITPTTYNVCANATVAMTATGASVGGGITYQWQVGPTSGGPYTNVVGGTGATTTSYTTAALTAGVYYYVLQVTCSNGPSISLSNEVTVTVNGAPPVVVTPTTFTICGSSPGTPLTASGASTYSWSPAYGLSSTTGATVTASPAAIVTYTVTGTDGNGCTNTATAQINWAPTVSGLAATATANAICIGDTIDLNATSNANTAVLSENFSGGFPAWTITNALTSPLVSNFASRTPPYNNTSPSAPFTNFATPSGGNFVMSDADAGGSGSTTNTVLTSPVFSTMGMTSATLTFENLYQKWASGDITVSLDISTNGGNTWTVLRDYLTLGTQGNVTANAQVPNNESINLSAYLNQPNLRLRYNYVSTWGYYWIIDNVVVSGNLPNTYAWTSNPSGFNSTLQNPEDIVPTVTTDYIVTATNAQGCAANAQVTVTVNQLPVVTASANDSTVCNGDMVTLNGGGATTYTWTGGQTDNTPFTAMASETFTVTGTDANGCEDTASIMITVNALPTVSASASDSTICSGDMITFNGGGATSYTWTGGVTDNTPFMPTVSDTYTVTGVDANGCQDTASVMVTVNALPSVTANTSAAVLCAGDSVTLSGSGSATSYSWSGGVTDNMAFVPVSTMMYVVTGTDANGCMNMDSVNVTVNSLPLVMATATDSTLCAGDSVAVIGTGATSYTWNNGVTDGVSFMPVTSGMYVVTGTDANGCVNMDSLMITVNAAPAITASASDTTVCNGSQVTLNGGGGVSYSWSGGVTNNQAFTPVTTDTYIVTGTDANGCTNTASVMVTVNPLPTVTFNLSTGTVCLDDAPVALTGASPAGGTFSGTGVSGTNFTPLAAGVGTETITYTYTDANGCTNSANSAIVVDACISVNEQSATSSISIYPNPNTGSFSIALAAMPAEPLQVEVLNALGQVIDRFTMNSTVKQVEMGTVEGGLYFVRILDGTNVSMHRIIKQ